MAAIVSSVPYREQEIMPVCCECHELAVGACERCDRPLCESHDKTSDMRCVECESHFFARLTAAKTRTGRTAILVSIFCGGLVVAAGPAFLWSLGYPTVINVVLLPFIAWRQRALVPRKTYLSFLEERVQLSLAKPKGVKLLPVAPAKEPR